MCPQKPEQSLFDPAPPMVAGRAASGPGVRRCLRNTPAFAPVDCSGTGAGRCPPSVFPIGRVSAVAWDIAFHFCADERQGCGVVVAAQPAATSVVEYDQIVAARRCHVEAVAWASWDALKPALERCRTPGANLDQIAFACLGPRARRRASKRETQAEPTKQSHFLGHVGSAKAIRKACRNFKRALPSPRRSSGCATTQPTSTSALAGSVCRTPCLRALQRLYGSASVCGGSRRHVPGAARRSVLVLSLGQCQPRRRAHASSAPWIFSPDCCSRFLLRRPQPGCGASPRDLPAGRLALPNRARCWRVGHRYVCAPHRLRKGRRLHRGHEWSLPLEPRRMHVRMHV